MAVAKLAKAKKVKNGVVQDKLFLPGLRKIRMLRDSGFFGRMFAVRGEFGYWVFEGDWGQPAQRPSWNYKKAEGGGIILDMLCHWRYVFDNLFGKVQAVSCLGATHIPKRVDESGKTYEADTDDAAYATFKLENDVDRAHELILVRAGPPRRSCDLPGRRHARLGRGRFDQMLDPASREHAEAGMESRCSADHEFPVAVGGSAR